MDRIELLAMMAATIKAGSFADTRNVMQSDENCVSCAKKILALIEQEKTVNVTDAYTDKELQSRQLAELIFQTSEDEINFWGADGSGFVKGGYDTANAYVGADGLLHTSVSLNNNKVLLELLGRYFKLGKPSYIK